MPETYATPAIVLNRRPYRGYDQRVSLYTLEKGKVELVVKGAARPASRLAAHLEPLNRLDIMVVLGKIPFVGGASSRDCFPNLKGDYDKLAAAGAAIGRLNRLLKEHVRDAEIFALTQSFLELLDSRRAEAAWYGYASELFLYKILGRLGYGIDLESCVRCSAQLSGDCAFSLADHGFLGHECQIPNGHSLKLSAEGRKRLANANGQGLDETLAESLSRAQMEELRALLDTWIRYISEF